jgi:hypothetical protein
VILGLDMHGHGDYTLAFDVYLALALALVPLAAVATITLSAVASTALAPAAGAAALAACLRHLDVNLDDVDSLGLRMRRRW